MSVAALFAALRAADRVVLLHADSEVPLRPVPGAGDWVGSAILDGQPYRVRCSLCEVRGTLEVESTGHGVLKLSLVRSGEGWGDFEAEGAVLRVGLPGSPPPPAGARLPGTPDCVVVPRCPPLALPPPRSDRAIVTLAHGEAGQALLAISRPFLEHYARRCGADLVVLDWPGHSAWPMSAKYTIPRALDHYQRIVYMDADVIPQVASPNLFDLVPPEAVGVVDEMHWHRRRPQYAVEQHFRSATGSASARYFNAGLMVLSRCHQYLVEAPPHPVLAHHLTEQHSTNAAVERAGVPVVWLDEQYNRQWWWDGSGFQDAPPHAILHFSGMKHADRLREMKRVADTLPSATLPLPAETWAPVFEPFRGLRVGLVRMPLGNVGDLLLERAALKLFAHFGAAAELLDPRDEDFRERATAQGALAVAGGGNMGGHLNADARHVRETLLELGPPVTVLPQSWYGYEHDDRYAATWTRERGSLRYQRGAGLAHDLSLCLTPADLGERELLPEPQDAGPVVWLRRDGEGLFRDRPGAGDPAVCRTPEEYFRLAASCTEIITDRVHFAVCGLIAGRKVTLLPGCYHKARALWEHSLKALGCRWSDAP